MRVTFKHLERPFLQNLYEIQNRKDKEEQRITTGKSIVNMADAPEKLVDVKKVQSLIDQSNNYKNIIENSLSEMRAGLDALDGISNNINNIRSQVIDATQIGNSGSLTSIANYIRGMLDDMVRLANTDYDGKLLFSGTKTTPSTLNSQSQGIDNLPYEIIKGEATPDNPSGLTVIFRGNDKDRVINKDSQSTEIINIKSSEAFGNNGVELFENVIKIYNLINYKADGTVRSVTDPLNKDEMNKLSEFQTSLSKFNDTLNNINGKVGGKINRLDLVSEQMTEELVRYNEYKSLKGDTDMAQAAINLKQEETALQYTLQVGANLAQNSLFDFLR